VDALRIAELGHARLLAEKLHATKDQSAGPNFTGVARAKKAVILSYSTAPERSYMWVTTSQESKMFPLPPEVELRDRIKRHNEPILEERPIGEDQGGRELYDLLIAPAAGALSPGSHVIVIPDGPISDLNFETLIPPGQNPRYWVESAVVTVAPSLTLLDPKQQQRPIHPKSVLGVGAAIQADKNLPALGDKELRDLSAIYQQTAVSLKGAEATPAGFVQAKPSQYSLIHLSAHAIANPQSPLDSYLVLSPDANGEYRLYAHDLQNLNIKADLVTLSACQSAAAKNVPGEGLVGLAWAVLSGGARNVVASLWPVGAPDTAELMNHFYTHLHAGEPPDQALHSAKLEIARQPGATPYQWAAFQLYSR
jgi:CHAT domain-containing protein